MRRFYPCPDPPRSPLMRVVMLPVVIGYSFYWHPCQGWRWAWSLAKRSLYPDRDPD